MSNSQDNLSRPLFKDDEALFDDSYQAELEEQRNRPVQCLGMEFPNDEARREYFLERLREHLQDPEFRKIDGFPIGEDDDILALSDPPYYTACPNPFLADFVKHHGLPYDPSEPYHRKPFAADVSEGKYDPLYKIHAYPTKVPFRAIMRYILHFTEPGDVVFDGFAGTGMTGVAAAMCGNPHEFSSIAIPASDFVQGQRASVLCDISTNATHIASNYVRHLDSRLFSKYFEAYIAACEERIKTLYETKDSSTGGMGVINYVVWSEVFLCEHCSREFSYWDSAVTYSPGDALGVVSKKPKCPHCSAAATRRNNQNAVETVFDPFLGKAIQQKKHVPVLVNYSVGKSRREKEPDAYDLQLIQTINDTLQDISDSIRTAPLMFKNGDSWGDLQRGYHLGITHTHHFFSNRSLHVLAALNDELRRVERPYRDAIGFLITASFNRITNLVRYMPQYKERNVGPLSGTLYKPMLFGELNILNVLGAKGRRAAEGLSKLPTTISCAIATQSSNDLGGQVGNNSIDYIFTDPPFGDNLPYSELNFNEETWLGLHTNIAREAIVNNTQEKNVDEYRALITSCFRENNRVLKPGRWMTVVFHNSRNAIWNAIQESLFEAGFVIADVRILDKERGTTKQQVYTSGAVKQDLVISAYKPNGGLVERFKLSAGTEEGGWDFTRTHLKQLPVFVSKDGLVEVIAERQNFLLYDRMIAFHVQRGVTVPISAAAFYEGLVQRFAERDAMYFLPEQVAEYDRKRMSVKKVLQLDLFVMDEFSAIQWLKQQLMRRPQTFQELHPQFIKKIGGWRKHENPLELSRLLEQNLLRYEGREEVPSQIHSYLSTNYKELRNKRKDDLLLKAKGKDRWYVPDPKRAGDLEKLRERSLLKEFEEYNTSKSKRLKVFRMEAMRAGFKRAYDQRDYRTIVNIAGKIPESVLQEDEKLLMYYDVARMRLGTDD